jgi:4-carboxymuconolactone decarboxylase
MGSSRARFRDVFAQRGIGAGQLSAASPKLLAMNEGSEAKRAASVRESIGPASPGLVQYTGDLLFHDLWLRPDLAPRDRSLVTISALIATGEFAQLPSHLGRALDNGLTKPQLAEVLTHVAFYAGWPNAFSAAAIAKDVLERRTN